MSRDSHFIKRVENFNFLKVIGKVILIIFILLNLCIYIFQGSFATVYQGYDTVNNNYVAIKEMDRPA